MRSSHRRAAARARFEIYDSEALDETFVLVPSADHDVYVTEGKDRRKLVITHEWQYGHSFGNAKVLRVLD